MEITGMPAATAFWIDGPSAGRVGDRDDQAGRLLVHGRVDELAHGDHVEGLGRAVIDLDLHVLAGRGDAVLHHRPERVVGLAVADDDDAAGPAGPRPARRRGSGLPRQPSRS